MLSFVDAVLASRGLVGFWPLWGSGYTNGTLEECTNSNRDYLMGMGTRFTPPVPGSGFIGYVEQQTPKFDSTGHLHRPNYSILNVGDVFTVGCMVKYAAGDTNTYGFVSGTYDQVYVRVQGSGSVHLIKSQAVDIVGANGPGIHDGMTHSIFVTKNGATVRLIIDGVNRTGSVTNATMTGGVAEWRIGAEAVGDQSPLVGTIGNVGLWNRDLPEADCVYYGKLALGG
jgi:hypothetical protein